MDTFEKVFLLSPSYRVDTIRHIETYVVGVVSRIRPVTPIGLYREGAGQMGLTLYVDTFAFVRFAVCPLVV